MLPPLGPLVVVEIAWPPAGATPKQPIIGASGSTKPASAAGGSSSCAVCALRSIRHVTRSRAGRCGTNGGFTTFWLVADVLFLEEDECGQGGCIVEPLYGDPNMTTPLLSTASAVASSFNPPYPPIPP